MPSDYDRIGGAAALTAVVDEFYRRVLADDHLAPYFSETSMPALRRHQTLMLTTALGGPDTYAGRPLDEAHSGLGVDDADYDRVGAHLTTCLSEAGVPADILGRVADTLAAVRPAIVADER
ncbi:MAG: group I truncated hemoglobin [Dermatophilaceae bacterium]